MPAQLLGDISINGITGAASGSVRFYQPTTLIPVVVYSNDAATAAITQPIALDANGRSGTPIYVTKMVRMIVYDANGAQLQDVERADGLRAETVSLINTSWPLAATEDAAWTQLATSLGATNGNFKASGVGALARSVQTKLSERLSVKDFGALGNGIADDTASIVASIAAATILGGAAIYVPAGTYLISQTISLASNVSLVGDGPAASVLKSSSSTADAFAITGLSNVSFDFIGIANTGTSTGAAVTITGVCSNVSFYRTIISGHRTGITQPSGSFTTNTGISILLRDTSITSDANAASVCVNVTNVTGGLVLYGGNFRSGSSAVGVCVAVGTTNCLTFAFGGIYVAQNCFTSTGGDLTLIGLFASPSNLVWSVSGTARVICVGIQNAGNVVPLAASALTIDPSNGLWGGDGPMNIQSIGTTSGYTPDNTKYPAHKITATAAGITITINDPLLLAQSGAKISFLLYNNSGGAVTWAFGPNYRVAAVAPATGTAIGLTVISDRAAGRWHELSRGSAA